MVRRIILDLRDADSTRRSMRELNKEMTSLGDGRSRASAVILRKLTRRLEVYHIKPMMSELKEVPQKRKYPDDYPIEFTTDKQRRYVMWMLQGKPYKRTNRIVNSWGYKMKMRRNRLSIEVDNDAPEHVFVVGRSGTGISTRSIKRYLKPMQDFHKTTGWNPSYEIITKYIQSAKEDSVETVREWLQRGVYT